MAVLHTGELSFLSLTGKSRLWYFISRLWLNFERPLDFGFIFFFLPFLPIKKKGGRPFNVFFYNRMWCIDFFYDEFKNGKDSTQFLVTQFIDQFPSHLIQNNIWLISI
jgi:hypothetical protein